MIDIRDAWRCPDWDDISCELCRSSFCSIPHICHIPVLWSLFVVQMRLIKYATLSTSIISSIQLSCGSYVYRLTSSSLLVFGSMYCFWWLFSEFNRWGGSIAILFVMLGSSSRRWIGGSLNSSLGVLEIEPWSLLCSNPKGTGGLTTLLDLTRIPCKLHQEKTCDPSFLDDIPFG